MNSPSSRENRDTLIAGLAEDLKPVRSFNSRDGALFVGVATLATLLGVFMYKGFWQGMIEGQAAPFFWVTNGLLLLLGLSAATAVITMASPKVGNRYEAPRWASAMIAVLPIAALITLTTGSHPSHGVTDGIAQHCMTNSLIASVLVGSALTLWLRRGAPVSINLAGWFTGVASGALGTAAYGLSCSVDTVAHLGIAHVAPVAITALLGRLVVPSLVRW